MVAAYMSSAELPQSSPGPPDGVQHGLPFEGTAPVEMLEVHPDLRGQQPLRSQLCRLLPPSTAGPATPAAGLRTLDKTPELRSRHAAERNATSPRPT